MKIYIDANVCKGCSLCVHYCPRDVLRLSEVRNKKGYTIAEVYDVGDCTGCRLCEINCPDVAIYVVDED